MACAQNNQQLAQGDLFGRTNVRSIANNNRFQWFKQGYDAYIVNASAVAQLQQLPSNVTIIVFAATWCEDTQKLLPQFFRVINAAGIHDKKITMYMVDRDKHTPEGLEQQFQITRVPTFIVCKNGIEIGRITEQVSQSIEADLADMLSNNK